jgi:APA family basic amino acid/polyamine antiporter
VAAGAATPDGFNAMVAYTSPVFWTFMYLIATSLFLMRERGKDKPAFLVPWYPHVPFVFCMACLYMLYSSIDYVRNPDYGPKFGWAVGAGLIVMAAGIPLYFWSRQK